MDYISRAPLSSRPHTSGVRSRCAVGILLSASCPNRSSEAHGTKVSPQEWASLRRTLFFYTSPPRSPQQQRIGYKDWLRPDRQLQIWTLFRLRVSFSGGDNLDNLDSSEDKSKTSWEVFVWGGKCVPLRCLALLQSSLWFSCYCWEWRADLVLTPGRVRLPALVSGSSWTAVGWKGDKHYQPWSRSGQLNCESTGSAFDLNRCE